MSATTIAQDATTLEAICERYIDRQANAGTRKTYRSLLGPVIEQHGAITVDELTPTTWAAIQRELGEAKAPKTRKYLATALEQAGYRNVGHWLRYGAEKQAPSAGELVTLTDAAKQYRIAKASLRALTDAQKVRCHDRRRHGDMERITFDTAHLAADLAALPPCQTPRCEAPGTGPSGYCGEHFGHGGRQRAQKTEQDLLADPELDWYSTAQAATAAPCSPSTINAAIIAGELPSEKTGRIRRIPKAELHRWAEGLPADRLLGRKPLSTGARERRREQIKRDLANRQSPPAIAQRLGLSKHTVYREMGILGLAEVVRSSRPLTPAEIRRVAELYVEEGWTLRALAAEFGCSVSQIRDQLERLGVRRRPSGTAPIHPAPTERRCSICEQPFTPVSRSFWDQRFCSLRCVGKARRDANRAALTDNGLLSVQEAAGRLGLSQASVYGLHSRRALVGEEVSSPIFGRPVWGVREAELDRFCRDRARGEGKDDGRRLRWLDEDKAIEQMRRMGILERKAKRMKIGISEVELLERARIARRGKQFRRRRQGRTGGAGAPDHVYRWAARYEELEQELVETWKQQKDEGLPAGRRPSNRAICRAVALDDWAEHPEIWPRRDWPENPNDRGSLHPGREKQAEDKVLTALKRLQTAVTEISVD